MVPYGGTRPLIVNAAFSDEVIVTNQTTGVVLSNQYITYNPAVSGTIAAGSGAARSTTVTLPAGTAGVRRLQRVRHLPFSFPAHVNSSFAAQGQHG